MSGRKGYRRMRKAMRREDARAFEAFMENHNLELAQREAEEAKAQRAEDEAFADRFPVNLTNPPELPNSVAKQQTLQMQSFLTGMMAGLDTNKEEAHG